MGFNARKQKLVQNLSKYYDKSCLYKLREELSADGYESLLEKRPFAVETSEWIKVANLLRK